tara:strand:+ start:786 stop:1115 length:330 start_codon:yes stop_codon:yes gene_type:complete
MINVESINRENGKVTITVSVLPFDNFNHNKKISVTTSDIEKILKEKRIKFSSCIQEGHILNRRKKTCRSTWVFEVPRSSKRKKSRNSKKTLDKSVEDVIIIEEQKEQEE